MVKKNYILKFAHLFCDGFSFYTTSILIFIGEGLSIKYVPVTINKREGKSTVRPKDALNTFILILQTILLSSPLRVFLPITGILIAGSVISFIVDMFQSYHTNLHVSTATLFLSLSSILIFFFGLMADQIAAIRKELNK